MTEDYKWMSANEVEQFIPEIVQAKVSKKALSEGFTKVYLRVRNKDRMKDLPSDQEGLTWGEKRDLFIKRTLPAYRLKPTRRRELSLVAWAYMPEE